MQASIATMLPSPLTTKLATILQLQSTTQTVRKYSTALVHGSKSVQTVLSRCRGPSGSRQLCCDVSGLRCSRRGRLAV